MKQHVNNMASLFKLVYVHQIVCAAYSMRMQCVLLVYFVFDKFRFGLYWLLPQESRQDLWLIAGSYVCLFIYL